MIGNELQTLNKLRMVYGELPPMLKHHDLEALGEVSHIFGDALIQFGRCERLARRLERTGAATDTKESKEELAAIARLNRRGQISLSKAIDYMRSAEVTLSSSDQKKATTSLKSALGDFSDDLIRFLADGDIKPSDVTKLRAVQDEIVGIIIAKGIPALKDHVFNNLEKLKELRDRPDRGAVDNVPWWKLVAIAVFLGLWVIAVARCINNRKNCSDTTAAALAAGMTIAWLVVYFC